MPPIKRNELRAAYAWIFAAGNRCISRFGPRTWRQLGIPVTLVFFDAAGRAFEAIKANAWDVAFLAVDPARTTEIFSRLPTSLSKEPTLFATAPPS